MCTHLNKTGSIYYFRRPVPDDLIGHFKTKTGKPRSEWKISLRTKDREEAKRLKLPHEAHTSAIIDEARLTLARQAEARSEAGRMPSAAGPRSWADFDREQFELSEQISAEYASAEFEQEEFEPIIAALSAGRTPNATPAEINRAMQIRHLDEIRQAMAPAKALLERQQEREFAEAFAVYDIPEQLGSRSTKNSISELYERYASSGQAKPKTVNRWRSRVEELVEFLGHNDARRVTRADLNRWTASLVEKGLAKKTILAGYIPAIRVPFNLALEDGLLPDNPASGLKVRAPKTAKQRENDFTDEEALKILRATFEPQPAKLSMFNRLARRWVPWLCAYTGARVAEITQLRACDIQQEGDIWFINITPAAGSVKTGEARKVPLHPHLIEQDFIAFAKAGNPTPLFYRDGAGNENNPAPSLCASSLAKWVRTLGIDAPQPNHGWRHRFKTTARTVGMEEYVADKIQGHAPTNQSRGYGQVTLSVLQAGIKRLPRYNV